MGLPRLILMAILIGGGIWLWRRFNSRSARSTQQPSAQTVVRCAHCHVHIPQDRAIQKNQHWYCSTEHLQQGPQARD
ncbi:MAG TPA: hypothetical protein GX719_06180 [Gammaproteobacteria bacterium]|nr:hypothetical protein [Gammaproteobacteria bacterium]